MLRRAICTQQDLTLAMRISSEIFYARGRCLSFDTAKTLNSLRWSYCGKVAGHPFPL
jgi:hypothetical protein